MKVANGKAEARPDVPTGEKCPACGHDLVDEARPLRRLRRLHELPRLPLPAAEAGHDDRRHLPGVPDGRDPRPQGALRPVLRLLELPVLPEELPRAPGARSACPACAAPYLLVRDRKAGAFYVCEKEGCDFDEKAEKLDAFTPTTRIPEGALGSGARRGERARPGEGRARSAATRPTASQARRSCAGSRSRR